MALLGVSELMWDPDFITAVTLLTRSATINNYGETSITETSSTVAIVLQPASAKELARLPEGERTGEIVAAYYSGILTPGDVISSGGVRYIVRSVEQWTMWGAGYVKALAVREPV